MALVPILGAMLVLVACALLLAATIVAELAAYLAGLL